MKIDEVPFEQLPKEDKLKAIRLLEDVMALAKKTYEEGQKEMSEKLDRMKHLVN